MEWTAINEILLRVLHPFGDLRALRWTAFGLLFVLWALYPLLYRNTYRKAENLAAEDARLAPGQRRVARVKLGFSWLLIGLLGLTALVLIEVLPYSYGDLEWKVFAPFEQRGANRMITFLVVFPAVLIFAALQYAAEKKPVSAPSRLVLAGTRALGLLVIFFLICAPYTKRETTIERPFRSIVMLDNSLSMGDAVREFAVLSPVTLAPALVEELSRGTPADRERLERLTKLVHEDEEAAKAAREAVRVLGLPAPSVTAVELSDVLPEDFEMRSFVRDTAVRRAQRLKAKLTLMHGAELDVGEWVRQREKIDGLAEEYRRKLDEIGAAEQQEKPDLGYLRIARSDAASMKANLESEEGAFSSMIGGGILVSHMRRKRSDTPASAQAADRVDAAVAGVIENLLSTVNANGPTRWDVASEIMQPGNELTVQRPSGLRFIHLALAPGSGHLTLLDLLRRNESRQPDRFPQDIAVLLREAGIKLPAQPESLDKKKADGLHEPLSVYLFSDTEQGGGSDVMSETRVEELDFLRPRGKTTQIFAAYKSLMSGEANNGDVSTVLILGDGRDTSGEGAEEVQRKRAEMDGKDEAPTVICLGVGHPRPERVLHLLAVRGDAEVIKDEMVDFELRVRANADWEVDVVLCEDTPANEIEYDGLDGQRGKRHIKIEAGPNGEERVTSVRLRFTPKAGGAHQYWIKLNRRRLPGEDTYENNVWVHDLEVIDRKIRVLFIDQHFRYEARYLYEAAVRDKALEFHAFIYDAETGWKQPHSNYTREAETQVPPLSAAFCRIVDEGKPTAHTRRAREKEEWFKSKYDVVIVGDIEPTSKMTFDERRWLHEFVTQREGGVIWLAGPEHNPHSYTASTELQEIIPVKLGRPAGDYNLNVAEMKYYGLTPAGRTHDLMRFSETAELNQDLWGRTTEGGMYRPGQLDGFYWHARVEGPRDDLCSVLARVAQPGRKLRLYDTPDAEKASDALIVTREYESGRAMFVGTDEMWRMRRYFGDLYTYRFWQNAIRWAATSRLKAKKDDIALYTDKKHYMLGNPVHVFCELIGSAQLFEQIEARQKDELAKYRELPQYKDRQLLLVNWQNATAALAPGTDKELNSGTLVLVRSEARANLFEGRLHPNTVGKYEVRLHKEPSTAKNPTIFFVQASSEQMKELRETSLNADLLKGLSSLENAKAGAFEHMPVHASPSDTTDEARARPASARVRYHPFHKVSHTNPDLRTKMMSGNTEERDAFRLWELLAALTALFAAEWFIRKLVRLA